MRIVIHGQQVFGKAVAERLLGGADDVVAVFCPPDIEDRPMDPLKALALEEGLALHQLESWKTDAAADLLASLAADLCVMAYVTQLVPQNCLDIPALGTIQYHPSLLPRHRGPSSINWSIIAGETKTGLTVFWPDQGLDTGPILLQKEVEIGPDDTVGSIYFDHLFPMGVAALMEAVELVRSGSAPRIAQIEAEASYESWCRAADAEIDWAEPAEKIHCLIRGTDPQPGAWTTFDGNELQLFDTRMVDASGSPGEVVGVSDDGLVVAAEGGGILIQRLRPHDAGKIPAKEYIAGSSIAAGARLGR